MTCESSEDTFIYIKKFTCLMYLLRKYWRIWRESKSRKGGANENQQVEDPTQERVKGNSPNKVKVCPAIQRGAGRLRQQSSCELERLPDWEELDWEKLHSSGIEFEKEFASNAYKTKNFLNEEMFNKRRIKFYKERNIILYKCGLNVNISV